MVAASVFAASAEAGNPTRSDLLGASVHYRVKGTETLFDVARPHSLAFTEIMSANPGVDPWVPDAGTSLLLPARHVLPHGARTGILINLADMRLYYFPADDSDPVSFPIGIGRYNWTTPVGTTEIVRTAKNPSWYVPESIREEDPSWPAVVPPGPDNPLGKHALYLGIPGYLIHGTNKPWGIGMRVTHGCIRMFPEHVAWLYETAGPGTPVEIVDQPVKAGWDGNEFFVEVHREPDYAREAGADVETPPEFSPERMFPVAASVIQRAAGPQIAHIDWSRVRKAVQTASGVPTLVSLTPGALGPTATPDP